jgi:quercetin dioxygenase-like cupin family protein
MNTIDIPQTTILHIGKVFKVLRVTGNKGTSMPDHYCTHEAVITVQDGSAILRMSGTEYPILKSQSFIIPSGENHSLMLKDDFEAIVILKLDAEIKFV